MMLHNGIQNIYSFDLVCCRLRGRQVKPVAQATRLHNGKIAAFILPGQVEVDDAMVMVKEEHNGVETLGMGGNRHFVTGRGTIAHKAAAALFEDIFALRRGISYYYKKFSNPVPATPSSNFYLKVYISFTAITKVPVTEFSCVEQLLTFEGRSSMVAVIHFGLLLFDSGWRHIGLSLICLPDPVIEAHQIEQYQKRGIGLTRLFMQER